VMSQCTEVAHLDLSDNVIKDEGSESLAGVLGHCEALTHLNHWLTSISAAML
jgi:hypothetical protein